MLNNLNSDIISEKKISDIIQRVEFIQNIIDGTQFDPMINFNNLNDNILYDNKDISSIVSKKNIDCDDVYKYLGKNLEYIKSGSTGHTFKGSIKDNGIISNYAVKIVPYIKKDIYGDEYSSTRPENTEILILKNLSFFVINNFTPHVILPITTFYTDLEFLKKLFKNSEINPEKCNNYLKEFKKNNYHNNISVLISEWANGGDLLDYLRKNYLTLKVKEWRIILF
jgi:hypothetical protein